MRQALFVGPNTGIQSHQSHPTADAIPAYPLHPTDGVAKLLGNINHALDRLKADVSLQTWLRNWGCKIAPFSACLIMCLSKQPNLFMQARNGRNIRRDSLYRGEPLRPQGNALVYQSAVGVIVSGFSQLTFWVGNGKDEESGQDRRGMELSELKNNHLLLLSHQFNMNFCFKLKNYQANGNGFPVIMFLTAWYFFESLQIMFYDCVFCLHSSQR